MRSFLTLATIGLNAGLWAQCAFTPTITPVDLILRPGESALLSTQEYDSYQWFRDEQPVDGVTQPTLAVDYFTDSGYCLTVLAEQDACSELSTPVLVQGWVFLLP